MIENPSVNIYNSNFCLYVPHLAVGVPQLTDQVFFAHLILIIYGVLRSGTWIRVSAMLLGWLLLADEPVVTIEAYAIVHDFSVAQVSLLVAIHGIVYQKLLLRLTFALLLSLFDDPLLFQMLPRLIHLNFDNLIIFGLLRLVILEVDALFLLLEYLIL